MTNLTDIFIKSQRVCEVDMRREERKEGVKSGSVGHFFKKRKMSL